MSHDPSTGRASDAPAPTPPAAAPTATDTRPLTDVCFQNFALHPLLLKDLEAAGFVRLTPIQALTLPVTLAGRDVAGQAQTGTGKTLAFLVTIVNRLLSQPALAERREHDPRAVVLAPTRELAIQIERDARLMARNSGLRFALIYGGVDYDRQRELLRAGTDVVIATPGRLIDYVKQGVVSLGSTEIVVLDEADRMFDLGFIKDIRYLLRRMQPRAQRQSLLFSATLSHRVLELAYEHMNNAEKLTVETDSVTAERVRQKVYFPANDEKIPLLIGLLARTDCRRTMVFVNTKAWVEKVARALERAHFRVGTLSGDVPQLKREKLLARFKRGELEILVATDVAARGLHIPDVSHVFNFDLPFDAEDYVHRIGRTARLGAEGDAISFACELYAVSLPDIEAYIGQRIPVENVDPELLKPVQREPLPPLPEAAPDESDAGRQETPIRAHGERGRGPAKGDGGRRRRGGAHGGKPRAERRPEDASRPPRPPRPAAVVAGEGAEGAGRKRRRRRRGRGGAEREHAAKVETAAVLAAPEPVAEVHGGAHERPRFFGRIKQGLKAFVSRLARGRR
jgi:ATP-dependent RNA helicase RhlB